MKTKCAAWALCFCLAMAAGPATACSWVLQWRLPFPPGTTDVSSQQIAEISTWVERTSASGLRFDAVLVEGFAPSSASDAHALADSRTRKVARMIRTFTGNTLPISAHATIASGSATEDDEAVIQWVPSAPADVPGCPEPR